MHDWRDHSYLVSGPSAGLASALACMSSAKCLFTSFSSAASSVFANGSPEVTRLCLSRRTSALSATTLEIQLLLASLLLASDRSGVRPSEATLLAGIRALGLVRLSDSRDKLLRLADALLSLMVLRLPLTASVPEAPISACSSADEESPVPSVGRTSVAC